MSTSPIDNHLHSYSQIGISTQPSLSSEKNAAFDKLLEVKKAETPVSLESFLANVTNPITGIKLSESNGVTDEEITAAHNENAKKVDEILKKTLKALGISENASFTVKEDQSGVIRVTSNLSDAANKKLEQALNENDEFRTAFGYARRTSGMLKLLERHQEFSKAYDKNPQAAVAMYGIGSKSPDVNTIYRYFQGIGRYTTSFT